MKEAVVSGRVEKARRSAEQIVDQGLSVNTALETLSKAMKIVDQRFERKEFFVIDVASSAASMREAFKVFEPHLKVEPA
ncbi:MAG: B12-binding domain-containing protein, partial [Candidatus Bathyarchaeota archaeon]